MNIYTFCLEHEAYFVGDKAKGRISTNVFQENKANQIFQITKISYSLIRTRTYVCESGGKKCSIFGKFDVLCFLETPVWIYQRSMTEIFNKIVKKAPPWMWETRKIFVIMHSARARITILLVTLRISWPIALRPSFLMFTAFVPSVLS